MTWKKKAGTQGGSTGGEKKGKTAENRAGSPEIFVPKDRKNFDSCIYIGYNYLCMTISWRMPTSHTKGTYRQAMEDLQWFCWGRKDAVQKMSRSRMPAIPQGGALLFFGIDCGAGREKDRSVSVQ